MIHFGKCEERAQASCGVEWMCKSATYWYLSCVICNLKMGVCCRRTHSTRARLTVQFSPRLSFEKKENDFSVNAYEIYRNDWTIIGRPQRRPRSAVISKSPAWIFSDYEMRFDYSIVELSRTRLMPFRARLLFKINYLNLINSKNESLESICCYLLSAGFCIHAQPEPLFRTDFWKC